MSSLLDRFIKYTQFDTQSDPDALPEKHPTTDGQWDLMRYLKEEIEGLGINDVLLTENCVLMARIPANTDAPSIGFMAHVDTASDCKGNGVKARVIENYDAKDIVLESGLVIPVSENPGLVQYAGQTLVVTDGTTLLGSDDKAGVAEIISAAEFVLSHPEIKHGEIELLFTPDEETGAGMDCFPFEKLNSKTVYTLDGSERYIIETECFNAASVDVVFKGVTAHLGSAKNRMVNAVTAAAAFISAMPQAESPEATDNRDGYYCPYSIEGSTEEVRLHLMLRDFDFASLAKRIEALKSLAGTVELLYGGEICVKDSITYRNMVEAANANPKAEQVVFTAGRELGMPLEKQVIRGGTDGAHLAARGIPCPNIFTGGSNLHALTEWAALPAMEDAVKLIIRIIEIWAR